LHHGCVLSIGVIAELQRDVAVIAGAGAERDKEALFSSLIFS
jgi:hypothetical protein